MSFKEQLFSALQKKALDEQQTKQKQAAIRKQEEIARRKKAEEIVAAEQEFSAFLENLIKPYLEDFNQAVWNGKGHYYLISGSTDSLLEDGERNLLTIKVGLQWNETSLCSRFFLFQFFAGEKPFFLPLKMKFIAGGHSTNSTNIKIKTSDELQSFVKNKLLAIASGKVDTLSCSDCYN